MVAPPTFIKMCGITNLSDARAAVRAGANGIGFIFAPSLRRVAPAKAAAVASHLHPSVRRFGVFVNAPNPQIVRVAEKVGLDSVQLQGTETPEQIAELRALRPGLFISKAVRPGKETSNELLQSFKADAVMLDPRNVSEPEAQPDPVQFDNFAKLGIERLIVAGGLTPKNVAGLIAKVGPWGVDVSSGIEREPGRKDPKLMFDFVAAVRRGEGKR
ncbi:MAG TPA: phosphoribosylanthranilate isomerase [Actinomycetota bacterium]|nr:phosphoribosylanthranilate isomerase [Actinomycetota bacterium]